MLRSVDDASDDTRRFVKSLVATQMKFKAGELTKSELADLVTKSKTEITELTESMQALSGTVNGISAIVRRLWSCCFVVPVSEGLPRPGI